MNKRAEIDWGTVAKLFAGGALTGAGIGAGTSLVRYLQTLNQRAKEQNDTSYDDDVLYINLPPKGQPLANRTSADVPKFASEKQAADPNTVGTFAVGSLGGLLGTYMAYNAVRSVYHKARKKQLQKELDQAQNVYIGNLGNQANLQKEAASDFSMMTKGVGTGYLTLMLAAIGSGIVANRMLQKFYPPIKSPNRSRPRKIVVRKAQQPDQVSQTPEVTPDAVESLVRTNLSNGKSASLDCGIHDLVAAAASGRCREIKHNLEIGGVDFMFDACKGARHVKVSSLNRNLAITWLATDPLVSSAVQPVLAAEFYDMAPGICKLAAYVDEDYHDACVGMVESATCASRKAIYSKVANQFPESVKQAASHAATNLTAALLLPDALSKVISAAGEASKTEDTPNNISTPTSKDSPDMATKDTTFELADDEAKQFAEKYGPVIDSSVRKM